jgi:hypothetical protein
LTRTLPPYQAKKRFTGLSTVASQPDMKALDGRPALFLTEKLTFPSVISQLSDHLADLSQAAKNLQFHELRCKEVADVFGMQNISSKYFLYENDYDEMRKHFCRISSHFQTTITEVFEFITYLLRCG